MCFMIYFVAVGALFYYCVCKNRLPTVARPFHRRKTAYNCSMNISIDTKKNDSYSRALLALLILSRL